jgi:hypothetical protein
MNSLIWIAGFTFSLSIFICAVSVILSLLKIPNPLQNLSDKRPNGELNRRKVKTNPNIVCGFPVYQKAREEAPFF